jgi:hypothetical protein
MRITKPLSMSPSAGTTVSSMRGSGLVRSLAHFVVEDNGGPGSR